MPAEASAGSSVAAAGSDPGTPTDPTPSDDGVDYSHGSRFVIPQRLVPVVDLGTDGEFRAMGGAEIPAKDVQHIDVTISRTLADASFLPRSFDVSFGFTGLFVDGCQLWTGTFEVTSLQVTQDTGTTGAHLTIEPAAGQTAGQYTLTHDGPGAHQVRVTGTFKANHDSMSQGQCPALPMGMVEVPVAFTTKINIMPVGSVRGLAPTGCASPAIMLSGRNYPGTRISVLDDQGTYMGARNVYDTYPLDVIVETEKQADIAEGPSGFAYDGLVITGEPQKVRLSTSFGTLFTYQLADTSQVDGWNLQFFSRQSQYIKAVQYDLPLDTDPAVALGKVLLAKATLQVGGVNVCSPTLAGDFSTSLLSPDVCGIVFENSPTDLGTPGYLATFIDQAGTCELEVSAPAVNGGKGLTKHLSTIFMPPPTM
jgi:hypothetical protein